MDNDEKLIRKAKARIGFRIHSVIYFIVCLALTLFDIFIDNVNSQLVKEETKITNEQLNEFCNKNS